MKNNIKENFINTIFFEGDYMSNQTASGKEEVGKRLQFDIDKTLTKEQVEKLVIANKNVKKKYT